MPRSAGPTPSRCCPTTPCSACPSGSAGALARNTQILLADESNVGRVTDPGGGSWYLESLTDDIADAVWSRFQEVERAGGAVRALADGLVHGWVEEAVAARDREIVTRRRPITGVSMFPAGRDSAPVRRARAVLASTDRALAPRRDSTVFEGLRDRASALGDPTVLVRTLGTRRDFGARETFVTNLLAAAGVRAADDGSPVAVLASSPTGYAEHGAAAVGELRAAGRSACSSRAARPSSATTPTWSTARCTTASTSWPSSSDLLDRLGAPADPTVTTDETEGPR